MKGPADKHVLTGSDGLHKGIMHRSAQRIDYKKYKKYKKTKKQKMQKCKKYQKYKNTKNTKMQNIHFTRNIEYTIITYTHSTKQTQHNTSHNDNIKLTIKQRKPFLSHIHIRIYRER